MSNRFENKVAIVTGAAGEIGQALIKIMTDEGAKIVAVDHDGAGLAALEKSYAESGQPILAIQADVSKADAVEKLVKQATNTFGGIDIMVNNAGIAQMGDIESCTPAQWQKTLDINLTAVMTGTQKSIPRI
ncbi:MAG: SDR family NAD(P)-dependent oxidoreductase, partial [Henriciella sp.]